MAAGTHWFTRDESIDTLKGACLFRLSGENSYTITTFLYLAEQLFDLHASRPNRLRYDFDAYSVGHLSLYLRYQLEEYLEPDSLSNLRRALHRMAVTDGLKVDGIPRAKPSRADWEVISQEINWKWIDWELAAEWRRNAYRAHKRNAELRHGRPWEHIEAAQEEYDLAERVMAHNQALADVREEERTVACRAILDEIRKSRQDD
jgi:hypothetical protein